MNKINILSIGPGNPKYTLPIVFDLVMASDVVIGGKRNLENFDLKEKTVIEITNNVLDIIEFAKNNYKNKKISVLASGDSGFYGILSSFIKHFKSDELNVVAGISSLQYLFARLSMPWQDFYFGSVHGKNLDSITYLITQKNKVALLCDNKNSPQNIAKMLKDKNITNKRFIVGEMLSYDNEKILYFNINEMISYENYEMCVVIIYDE